MITILSREMPYADLEEKREKQRIAYRMKYWRKKGFRQAESQRKAEYYKNNPEYAEAVANRVYASRGKE
jgi:hypothetical protein